LGFSHWVQIKLVDNIGKLWPPTLGSWNDLFSSFFSCHFMSIVWREMQGPLSSVQHGWCHRGLWTTLLVRADGFPDITGC
jgi:hypothetical protein